MILLLPIGSAVCGLPTQQIHTHLTVAVTAYRQALEVWTRTDLPQGWAMTQNNLAKVLVILQDWPNAVISYVNVLRVYPDYREAYQAASALYHNRLFQFP
jgi:hypothetical protein